MAIMVPIAEGICDGSYGIAQPMYTSYGIDEQYIPRHFNNDKGEQALSLADLRFWSENYAPFPAVRLTSWRKACRVTVEWNSGCFGEAFMRVFLAELADLMLFFASPELKDQQPEDRAEEA
ncbi:MAG: hypothetical protein L6R42_010671 [Xanthoria sp. 1 TBL-2021]|nr:MAG: hypothetical protein L6R42_010671 [Xanthoria sp. 1 TBL-2021]